jgi:uncharacterized RDD family membrane protein YckC
MAVAAPTGYSGANALAPQFEANESQDFMPLPDLAPQQATLFTGRGPKVIPFDRLQRQAPPGKTQPAARSAQQTPEPHAGKSRQTTRSERTQTNRTAVNQGQLDFLSSAPAQRTLKTDVPAQIYCNRPVATPTHRFVAGAMDTAMVLMGFGLFVGITELMGGSFGSGKLFWAMIALSFILISVFYGLAFALSGRETAGMHWTDLQLITFDGFPVDGKSRAARVASTWLSFCSGGLGLVWALADEETLTWQDHISRTFPTIRETAGTFVRQG